MDKVFSVRLSAKLAETVETLCKKEDRPAGAMIRVLVKEGLEARELMKESERVPV